MRKSKILLSALLCASFGLTACDFNDVLAQIGIGEKKVVEDNENENQGTSTGDEGQGGQSGDQGQGGSQGGQTGGETTITLQYIEDLIKPIAASVFEVGLDQLNFIEFDTWDPDEEYENVIFSHEQSDLVFAGLFNSVDWEDQGDSIEEYVSMLEHYLPQNAVKNEELSEGSPQEGYYLNLYKCENLYHVIYGEDQWLWFDYLYAVVPESEVEAFLDYAFTEEDDSTDYDDYDDSDIDLESLFA